MTDKRYLLAIDPGLKTGICIIDITDINNPVKWWSAEWTMEEFFGAIAKVMSGPSIVEVVIEDFRITDATGDLSEAPWSLKLIGVTEYLGFCYGKSVVMQQPVEKAFATNERLKLVDFWHVGGAGHANDAFKHAMVWIVKKNRKWTKNLIL
ncbi:RuvC-like resolvase [Arthrobacter phage Atuin]|nr:RuvC-like resolvase [Arthrobacter phage Atuin]